MSYDIEVNLTRCLYSKNYTSNVAEMYYKAWDKVKDSIVYENIWCNYDKDDWKQVIQLPQPTSLRALKAILDELKSNPEEYLPLNPENGWGDYKGAIQFLQGAYDNMLVSDDCMVTLSC